MYQSDDVTYTAVAVSFLLRNYSNTEGTALFVEVCVQIVIGTLSQTASVNLWTVSQSATGEYIVIGKSCIYIICFSFQLAVIFPC